MTPDPLTAALTAATLAVAVLVATLAKRALGKTKSLPPPPKPPPQPPPATESGSWLTVPQLLSDAMDKGLQPVRDRLDRIEKKQDENTARLGGLTERLARIEGALE
jgi:hypothetical protein